MQSAHDLVKAWGKGIRLHVVDDAGHSAKEPGTLKVLTEVKCDANIADTRRWTSLVGSSRVSARRIITKYMGARPAEAGTFRS